ncbi:MAG TPA: bifunctional 23S rRNA (guanine(2069)-N(7))-methyltransferase RlmK/23S rRNA (guanine(2445)-N(2))-methyltransferase RlmL [Nevskiales bacterium]|nr:bifunctional 23S rRNA (guanine(2069)-N(7))-methyltransferase RlmK/23S rRNA (guanine(2445)-N(2))-methyltransferase RlmL [Nevskiales bacterium]
MNRLALFATAPQGIEPLLAAELRAFGAVEPQPGNGGVAFQGDLETAYRACLWSRLASRILLPLASALPADDADTLYAAARQLPWEEHLDPAHTLAVDFIGTNRAIRHSQFGAQRIKDAIVDCLREQCGRRPAIDTVRPDLRINAHLHGAALTLAIDLSGDSLHRRGYRVTTVAAPMKENLAAALLAKLDWPTLARQGCALLDPLCGSGTLVIEAALMAADIAPGLLREYWGFQGWRGHTAAVWQDLLAEARERRRIGLARSLPPLTGRDRDARAVAAARANAARAGLEQVVRFVQGSLEDMQPPAGAAMGLLVTNPPYGQRLGEQVELEQLYARLGDLLKARFAGWRAAVFTGNPQLGKRMGLKAVKSNAFHNGALPCKLLQFRVEPEFFVDREALDRRAREQALSSALSEGGEAFANRLRKNLRTLGRWAEREDIQCYRLYDADLPEYAVAVDVYGDWLHVQEYAPPAAIAPAKAARRLEHVMTLLPEVLGIPPERIALKVRARQKGTAQYRKQADTGRFLAVREGPARLWVNLTDYLDSGLFLDHRPVRTWLRGQAAGKRFLNLFCYTAAATVHAALGGAAATTSVDLSRTYLDWAARNLELNGLQPGPRHRLIQADCRQWLLRERGEYDLIFLDPPTFSNSKRMEGVLDIQRDHVALIRAAVARLARGGVLVFSTNHRRFRLEREALADLAIEDVTRWSIPKDFARNPRIHQCWRIRRG